MALFWLLSAPAHLRACGAAALKTDFTRTGKRTVAGVVGDAWHSTQRYFLANFVDAWRQDCVELFLSNYRVRCHAPWVERHTRKCFRAQMLTSLRWIKLPSC